MKTLRRAILSAAILAAAPLLEAQHPPNPLLKPLAFLAGRWVSTTPTELQEETWSPPLGDSIVGSFRILENARPVFYEFWAIEIDNNLPILKLKHFNTNLSGWEDKNDSTKMPLVSISANDAVFAEPDGSVSLHYHRTADQLTCLVHHVRNGKATDESFALTRASQD